MFKHKKIDTLCNASKKGQLAKVEKLIREKTNPNKKDACGNTPLCIACKNGHRDVVVHLLSNGAWVHFTDDKGKPPIFYAILNGCFEIFEYLIKKGADPFENNSYLKIAIEHRRIEIIKFLIKGGADPKYLWNDVCEIKRIEIFKIFIEQGFLPPEIKKNAACDLKKAFVVFKPQILSLILCAREMDKDSFIHKNSFPFDVFKILFYLIKDNCIQFELNKINFIY